MAFSDIFQLSDVEKISRDFKQYIVTPAIDFGVAGFVFDVAGDVVHESSNDITDHFVEDNSFIQDHAASKPLRVTLRGFVGELVQKPDEIQDQARDLVERLVVLDAYLPQLTAQASQARDTLENINDFDLQNDLSNLSNLYATLQNLDPTASRQQRAYLFFKALKDRRVPMSLQTPFEFLQDMMVETLLARQNANSGDIAEFEITLKQIRTATIAFEPFDAGNFQSRAAIQNAPIDEKGTAQGENVSVAFGGLREGGIIDDNTPSYRINIFRNN